MGIKFTIDEQYSLASWSGLVTAAEFLGHVNRMVANPDWPTQHKLHISDISYAQADESITPQVRADAARIFCSDMNRIYGLKAAIIPGSNFNVVVDYLQQIMRHGGTTVVAFHRLADACSWMGLDEQHVLGTITKLRHS